MNTSASSMQLAMPTKNIHSQQQAKSAFTVLTHVLRVVQAPETKTTFTLMGITSCMS